MNGAGPVIQYPSRPREAGRWARQAIGRAGGAMVLGVCRKTSGVCRVSRPLEALCVVLCHRRAGVHKTCWVHRASRSLDASCRAGRHPVLVQRSDR